MCRGVMKAKNWYKCKALMKIYLCVWSLNWKLSHWRIPTCKFGPCDAIYFLMFLCFTNQTTLHTVTSWMSCIIFEHISQPLLHWSQISFQFSLSRWGSDTLIAFSAVSGVHCADMVNSGMWECSFWSLPALYTVACFMWLLIGTP